MRLPKVLCVCYIVSLFKYQKIVCILCCMCNIRYDHEDKRFSHGPQVFIHCIYFWNVFCCVFQFLLREFLMNDGGSIFIYATPCFYYASMQHWMLKTLNKMVKIHVDLRDVLDEYFCVSVSRAFFSAVVVSIETLSVIYWQTKMYSGIQRAVTVTFLLCWHLQFLLQMNSYIWMQCVYVSMNQVLTASLAHKKRWRMLKRVLKVHRRLVSIQREVASYFSVYILTVMANMAYTFSQIFMIGTGYNLECNRFVLLNLQFWQVWNFANVLILIGSLFLLRSDYKTERDHFLKGFAKSRLFSERIFSECNNFRFRYRSRCKQTLDCVDLLFITANHPKTLLCSSVSLWEVRIGQETKFVPRSSTFQNYIGLLILNICLVIVAAKTHGYVVSWEEKSYTFKENFVDNFTSFSFILSRNVSYCP
ncbi:hypothetical protein KR018_006850 [Drosophila ironensis]|nr:hypothetical protein KR018_006850 [Drosophila ironensis]